jgi:hypothetical protein
MANPCRTALAAAALFALTLVPASAGQATTALPDFGAAVFLPGAPINNPYFPMTSLGIRNTYIGEAVEGEPIDEIFQLTNVGPGPVILGVQTQAQLDRAFEDGLLVEETYDYFAQDTAGNVWYFGEDVTSFIYDEEGNLIDTNNDSAWRAGVNDALPGFIMPAELIIGFNYFQEFAPNDDALDEGTIFATGLTFTNDFGFTFTDVLQILETSQLSPDSRGFKFYAPGFGLIHEQEGLNKDFRNPDAAFRLAEIEAVPEPATWAMMLLGFGAAGAAIRHRRRKEAKLLQIA